MQCTHDTLMNAEGIEWREVQQILEVFCLALAGSAAANVAVVQATDSGIGGCPACLHEMDTRSKVVHLKARRDISLNERLEVPRCIWCGIYRKRRRNMQAFSMFALHLVGRGRCRFAMLATLKRYRIC